ncbi:MAG: DNA polymerase II [Halobacteriovoraceae bacterium]|nr:DNA polymerase II [Halobacteriovoraceae bacterium]|tara:strand:- start:98059 stop:100410 length:2352 start_codon:yes stop_codon:yes gene_type:complete
MIGDIGMEQNENFEIGFLLTASHEDVGNRHELHYYGRSLKGPFQIIIDKEKPVLFIERDSSPAALGIQYTRKPVGLKSFAQKEVDACYFDRQSDLYKFKDDAGVRTYEADVRTTERFLMERFIKGVIEFSGGYQEENGIRVYRNPQVRKSERSLDIPLSMLSFDIETSRGNDLYSIGLHYKSSSREVKRVYMVGRDSGPMEPGHGELFYFPDERSCYLQFERDLQDLDPDILLGWHVVGFDMVFLDRKCQSWGHSLNLGRRGTKVSISEKMGGMQFARIKGRVVIDGPNAMRAAFYQFDSWKLDSVANELLGTHKDIQSTGMEKVREIEERFKNDKPALAKYNIQDCILVTDIIEKTGLVKLMKTRVTLSGLLMDRQGVSTAAFDFFMLPLVHRKGLVAPNVLDIVRGLQATGGHVVQPESGLKEHVLVFDFKSLYPSIMMTFKIDPYSRLKSEINSVKTPAGISFSGTEHLLPTFIGHLMQQRQKAKQLGDQYLSQAIKILMNSFYGVMGSPGSRFYHADLPTAITETGQWILRDTIEYFENDGHQVVYGDTDSIFVKIPSGERFKEKGKQMARKANEHIEKALRKHFKVESKLEIEFETYYRKIFFPELRTGEGGAKKKYAGLAIEGEGQERLKFSGMEFVRSDWTKMAKEFQYLLFDKFFNGEDVTDIIKQTVDNLKEGKFDQKLVYKKRLSKKVEEYTKSLPPHVRAAKLAIEAGHQVDRDIFYVYTRRGPIPLELEHDDLDYQHYIDKQIRPISEVVLSPLELKFDDIITGNQLDFFL